MVYKFTGDGIYDFSSPDRREKSTGWFGGATTLHPRQAPRTPTRFCAPQEAAVFVGACRKAEAVVMSVDQYEAMQEASERQHAVAAALASVRADGLEPSPQDLALFAAVAAGELSTDELRDAVLGRYRK
jgi:Antitoxin VbhA